jgi:hypothetical protein
MRLQYIRTTYRFFVQKKKQKGVISFSGTDGFKIRCIHLFPEEEAKYCSNSQGPMLALPEPRQTQPGGGLDIGGRYHQEELLVSLV